MLSELGIVAPKWDPLVREQIYQHVFAHLDHEVGGFLIGSPRSADAPTHVTGAVRAVEAREAHASITFTHAAWAHVHEALEGEFAGQEIVGWYHSHPGFGVFLSQHDLFIHRNFFGDRAQVAYVVDPHAGLEGVFGWEDGEVVELSRGSVPASPPRPRSPAPPNVLRGLALYGLLGVLAGVLAWSLLLSGGDPERSAAPRAAPPGDQAPAAKAPLRSHPNVVEPPAGGSVDSSPSGP